MPDPHSSVPDPAPNWRTLVTTDFGPSISASTGKQVHRESSADPGAGSMPPMPLASALFQAIRQTLEVMFFVDVGPAASPAGRALEPSSAIPPKDETLWVEVPFEGTRQGCMRLGLEASLARYCHEGFQPEDVGDGDPFAMDGEQFPAEPAAAPRMEDAVPDAAQEQSLLELGNIVCGAFLSSAWPQGLFQVKEPRRLPCAKPPDSERSYSLGVSCRCETTEGQVEARVYFAPVPV